MLFIPDATNPAWQNVIIITIVTHLKSFILDRYEFVVKMSMGREVCSTSYYSARQSLLSSDCLYGPCLGWRHFHTRKTRMLGWLLQKLIICSTNAFTNHSFSWSFLEPKLLFSWQIPFQWIYVYLLTNMIPTKENITRDKHPMTRTSKIAGIYWTTIGSMLTVSSAT